MTEEYLAVKSGTSQDLTTAYKSAVADDVLIVPILIQRRGNWRVNLDPTIYN
jgi:hypothetical protein